MLRQVTVEQGILQGLPASNPRITSFKGVPYAEPPVGSLRFHAPVPAKKWNGVRQAFAFSDIPVQPVPGLDQTSVYTREWNVDPEIQMSEDCLYLNVWTPAKSVDEKLPVFFWIYGGAWQVGYSAEMEMDGERIASRGIVVVSVNYRVNFFGFLCHPEITKENPSAPANFGFLDQQAALQWVHKNIGAFGGDADNVTIGGQSAGGGSVMYQMSCPANKGLFRRAIIESGMFYPVNSRLYLERSLEQAEHVGIDFFHFCGIEDVDKESALDKMRKLEVPYLMQKWSEFGGFPKSVMSWGPTIDGVFATGNFFENVQSGTAFDIPVLLGNTTDEFLEVPAKTNNSLEIGNSTDTSAAINVIELGIRYYQSLVEKFNNRRKSYFYKFDVPIPGSDNPGTFHSVDLWFFFETLGKCWRPFDGFHYDIARIMCDYWCNFIKTGDPNGYDRNGYRLPLWTEFTTEMPYRMNFGVTTKQNVDFPCENVRKYLDMLCEK